MIGIPDAYRGEAPKAFVKLKEGERATEDELIEFLKATAVQNRTPGRDRVPRRAAEDHGRQAVEERAAHRAGGENPISLVNYSPGRGRSQGSISSGSFGLTCFGFGFTTCGADAADADSAASAASIFGLGFGFAGGAV